MILSGLRGFGGDQFGFRAGVFSPETLDSIVGGKGSGVRKHGNTISAHMARQEPQLKYNSVVLPRPAANAVKKALATAMVGKDDDADFEDLGGRISTAGSGWARAGRGQAKHSTSTTEGCGMFGSVRPGPGPASTAGV